MMNRQDFLKSVLVGAGFSPILLNAKIREKHECEAVAYGNQIEYEVYDKKPTREIKRLLIRNMNETFRELKIKKEDIISIKFIEKSPAECGNPFNMRFCMGWLAKVRRKKG